MINQNDNTTPHSSSEYDKQILNTIPYYDKFHEETINLVETYMPQPKVWLDTGCGTGILIQKCLEHFDKTEFMLSDPSEAMMTVAREKFSEHSSRVTFLKPVTTQDIPLCLTANPDVITAIQAHHYLLCPRELRQRKHVLIY